MDDLISRQAAIDVIYGMHVGGKDAVEKSLANTYGADLREIVEEINDIPSAQQWTPCSERLPKNRQYVLVTYQYEYGLIDHGITWYGEAEKKWNTSRKVTAWMPLPEPYKGD